MCPSLYSPKTTHHNVVLALVLVLVLMVLVLMVLVWRSW
jgi:hypothetical protein